MSTPTIRVFGNPSDAELAALIAALPALAARPSPRTSETAPAPSPAPTLFSARRRTRPGRWRTPTAGRPRPSSSLTHQKSEQAER